MEETYERTTYIYVIKWDRQEATFSEMKHQIFTKVDKLWGFDIKKTNDNKVISLSQEMDGGESNMFIYPGAYLIIDKCKRQYPSDSPEYYPYVLSEEIWLKKQKEDSLKPLI